MSNIEYESEQVLQHKTLLNSKIRALSISELFAIIERVVIEYESVTELTNALEHSIEELHVTYFNKYSKNVSIVFYALINNSKYEYKSSVICKYLLNTYYN